MRHWWLMFVVAALLPLSGRGQVAEDNDADTVTSLRPRASSEQPRRDLAAVVEKIVSQTQAFRQQQGLGGVEVNEELTATAQDFAQYMAEHDRYGHGADGRRPSERAAAHGYDYCLVSENIAQAYSSQPMGDDELAKKFVEGWKESPEHRKNMLEPAVTQIGVAVAQSKNSGYYFAVQMFGRPASAAIRFEISNQTQGTLRYELGGQTLELPPQYTRTHQRCRSGQVTFLAAAAGEQESQTFKPRQTFEPHSGDRLKVVQAAPGQLEIQREQID